MALIIEIPIPAINTEAIHKGDCIRAQRREEIWRNGIVTSVTAEKITFLTLATVAANTGGTAYVIIRAAEVKAGDWKIIWTTDIETIYKYPEPEQAGEP